LRRGSPPAFLNNPEEAGRRFTETKMRLAFSTAMRERPDVIYLVSDGEPTDIEPGELLQKIEGWQGGHAGPRIVIHAISFGFANDRFMQEVSRRNNGTFRRVRSPMGFP
jgi:hypothetical protein